MKIPISTSPRLGTVNGLYMEHTPLLKGSFPSTDPDRVCLHSVVMYSGMLEQMQSNSIMSLSISTIPDRARLDAVIMYSGMLSPQFILAETATVEQSDRMAELAAEAKENFIARLQQFQVCRMQ